MNRSLTNVLFGGAAPAAAPSDYKIEGKITQTNVDEAAEALAGADSVILVCTLPTSTSSSSGSSIGVTWVDGLLLRGTVGGRLRYGCSEGTIRYLRNNVHVTREGHQRPIRYSSRRRSHARTM